MRACVCVRKCVCARARACVCACVHARVFVHEWVGVCIVLAYVCLHVCETIRAELMEAQKRAWKMYTITQTPPPTPPPKKKSFKLQEQSQLSPARSHFIKQHQTQLPSNTVLVVHSPVRWSPDNSNDVAMTLPAPRASTLRDRSNKLCAISVSRIG